MELLPLLVVDHAEDRALVGHAFAGGDAGDAYALVILNTHRGHDSAPTFEGASMAVSQGGGAVLVDALTGQEFSVASDGTLAPTVPPLGAMILVPQSQYVGGI